MNGSVYELQRQPCTRHTAMYTGRSLPCTRPYTHVHGPWTAVCTVRTHLWTTVYTGRKRPPCSWPAHGRVTVYPTVFGLWTAVYTVRTRTCTRRAHGPYTRPCSWAMNTVHGSVRPRTGPCSGHARLCTWYTVVYTGCKNDRVHGPHTAVYGQCTRPRLGHV